MYGYSQSKSAGSSRESAISPDQQAERQKQIEAAAYELLAEKGYRATSMLAIAKKANASNETLYKWYGNKQALFQSLVQHNAAEVARMLTESVSDGQHAIEALEIIAPVLLGLVTSDRAIVLNRAAAADVAETGVLGETLSKAGRETVAPLIADLLAQGQAAGHLIVPAGQTLAEVADAFISLLIGDLQIRRVIGAIGPLEPKAIEKRSSQAVGRFLALYGDRSTENRKSK